MMNERLVAEPTHGLSNDHLWVFSEPNSFRFVRHCHCRIDAIRRISRQEAARSQSISDNNEF